MKIDFSLANRALARVKIDPLTWSDRSGETLRWRTLRDYYLQTFLEALSEVPWTGGRKRSRLARTGRPHLRTDFRFVYDVPFDCARPVELQGNEYFVIEDRYLCTGLERAELLYITNGKMLRRVSATSCGRPGEAHDMEYLSCGPGNIRDMDVVTLRAGRPADIQGGGEIPDDPDTGEDYPDYRPPQYEPKFYEYLEHALAAKLCVLLTDDFRLHNQLLQEALLIRREAVSASMGASAAKLKPQKWWKEELGL
jgi:hypothetical protein